jgi:hypothetical protein
MFHTFHLERSALNDGAQDEDGAGSNCDAAGARR